MNIRSDRAPTRSYDQLVVPLMCGFGASAGALGGTFAGYLYGRDQALTAAGVLWYGVAGLLVGVVVGFFLGLVPACVLVALGNRAWAPAPIRVLLTALAGAAPITLFVLLSSGFAGGVVAFCVAVTGTPAALAAALIESRRASSR